MTGQNLLLLHQSYQFILLNLKHHIFVQMRGLFYSFNNSLKPTAPISEGAAIGLLMILSLLLISYQYVSNKLLTSPSQKLMENEKTKTNKKTTTKKPEKKIGDNEQWFSSIPEGRLTASNTYSLTLPLG